MRRLLIRAAVLLPLLAGSASSVSACKDSTAPGCCRICREGKACGDTCIERSDTCHVGPGCACNG